MPEPIKKGKTPLPFSLTNETQVRFKSHFDKSTDEVMNALLDAYERAQQPAAGAPASDSQLNELHAEIEKLSKERADTQTLLNKQTDTIAALQEEINDLKQQHQLLKEQSQQREKETNTLINDNQAMLESAREEANELRSQISDKDETIEKMKAEILELSREATGVPQDYQEVKDRAHALEDQAKEDRKVIDNLLEVKREQTKIIEQHLSEITHLKTTIEQLQDGGSIPLNTYPEGDILHFFPPLCARLVDEVCQRLTEEKQRRNPEAVVSPQIMLGDMFLRYIIQRYNTWFFRPMLSDNDIIRIVQEIAPDIQSMRQLKQILGIRD